VSNVPPTTTAAIENNSHPTPSAGYPAPLEGSASSVLLVAYHPRGKGLDGREGREGLGWET
jgi:hypothetical protein